MRATTYIFALIVAVAIGGEAATQEVPVAPLLTWLCGGIEASPTFSGWRIDTPVGPRYAERSGDRIFVPAAGQDRPFIEMILQSNGWMVRVGRGQWTTWRFVSTEWIAPGHPPLRPIGQTLEPSGMAEYFIDRHRRRAQGR